MTDTPTIRTHATLVGDSVPMHRDLPGFLPPDWEPGTPVLVVAGLPEGAELVNAGITGDDGHRFGEQEIIGAYYIVLPAPKPVPAPPATERVPWGVALLTERKVATPDGRYEPIQMVQHLDGGRTLLGGGEYDDDTEWSMSVPTADGMVEVLVEAPTGDDEQGAGDYCEGTCDLGWTRPHKHGDHAAATGDDEPQADTPAPHDFGDLSDPDHWPGKPMYPPWTCLFAALDTLDDSTGAAKSEARDELIGAVRTYRQTIENGEVVRRDGTDPTPDEVSAWLREHRWSKRVAAVGGGYGWATDDALAAVRALRDGGTR